MRPIMDEERLRVLPQRTIGQLVGPAGNAAQKPALVIRFLAVVVPHPVCIVGKVQRWAVERPHDEGRADPPHLPVALLPNQPSFGERSLVLWHRRKIALATQHQPQHLLAYVQRVLGSSRFPVARGTGRGRLR